MKKSINLQLLELIDNLREVPLERIKCFLLEDHKHVLPIIYYAQEQGFLSKPCTLITFNTLSVAKDPSCTDKISELRKLSETDPEKFIDWCISKLVKLDVDWIKVAMELGFIEDAVILGVSGESKKYTDHLGKTHRMEYIALPLENLGFYDDGGMKIDRNCRFLELLSILDCEFTRKRGFIFKKDAKKILLDLGLDSFVYQCHRCKIPWSDEVFKSEFYTSSNITPIKGWTGKKLFDEFANRAALVTIAKESEYCGGFEKSRQILHNVNQFLFDNRLFITGGEIIKPPPIEVKWSNWYYWEALEVSGKSRDGIKIPSKKPGVYQVKRKKQQSLLTIGKAKDLRKAIRERLIKGREPRTASAGKTIRQTEDITKVVIRWGETNRPSTAEEYLLMEHKKLYGKLPKYY